MKIVRNLFTNKFMIGTFYKESNEFKRAPINLPNQNEKKGPTETVLLQYVLDNSKKGDPTDVINKIDQFCSQNWMMNLGSEKGLIVRKKGFNEKVFKVLELGCYCGYSSLVFANQIKDRKDGKVFSIEIKEQYAKIAKKVHQHAGLADKVHIHIGTVETSLQFIKQNGPFDLIFIDHHKAYYLSDFKLIEANGGIRKGTIVVGDNIIYPGSPNYLAFFQKSTEYDSTLYHTYLEYSNNPDAVLISTKL